MNRTRIVCTLGPASSSEAAIEALVRAGMQVARLNFSHGNLEEKAGLIRAIRRVSARLRRPVAILQDLGGPKLRTGPLAGGPVGLEPGAAFTLTGRRVPGDAREVSVSPAGLPDGVRPGDPVLLNDGAIELAVEAVRGPDLRCRVVVGGTLSARKGINLPGSLIRLPILTPKDVRDLAFGLEQGVDWIALSFVRSADDVRRVRRRILRAGRTVPLIAKIERREAVAGLDDILGSADGLMVARGDLGVDIPLEQVPGAQKRIIEAANRAGKPVITATQMLKSMTESPRPTRAEAADVANAALDGTDAVMLSEETAVGRYPVESVRIMRRILDRAEDGFPFRAWTRKFDDSPGLPAQEAVARAACQLAETLDAAALLTCTLSGGTPRRVAKFRPPQPILALTPCPETFRRLALVWGTVPLRMPATRSAGGMERSALLLARRAGGLAPGQTVVLTAGLPLNGSGTTNLVKIAVVP